MTTCVLNAFRHHGRNSAVATRRMAVATGVLNAFRHQRKELANTGTRMQRQLRRCSTPFGINGGNSWASPMHPSGRYKCSTPFGINGRNSYFAALPRASVNVCSTPFGINGRNSWPCGARSRTTPSAQRLSASTEGTLQGRRRRQTSGSCSTPFGINGRNLDKWYEFGGVQDVLNAFRHQRKELDARSKVPRCRCGVLNAFRHQRKELRSDCAARSGANARGAQRLSASTEGTPPPAMRTMRYTFGAQRLSASLKELSTWPAGGTAIMLVLNAFPASRKELDVSSVLKRSARTGAQRLSASRRNSGQSCRSTERMGD